MSAESAAFEAVTHAAWLEWTVAKTVASGNGEAFIPAFVEMPLGFIQHELGFADGPSVVWTLEHLPQINRKNRKLLAAEAEHRRQKWSALISRGTATYT